MAYPWETDTTFRLYDSRNQQWNDYPKSTLGDYSQYGLRYPTEGGDPGDWVNVSGFGKSGGAGGGGEGSGEGGGGWEEIPTDLFPTSRSGLPEWGNAWAKSWLDSLNPWIGVGLSKSFTGMENPGQINDAQKEQLNYYTKENLRPVVQNLGYRGVLNSTTAENTISKLLAEMGAKSYEQAWKQQMDKLAAYQKGEALLTAILEATRMSESSNPFSPWESMIPYILGTGGEV